MKKYLLVFLFIATSCLGQQYNYFINGFLQMQNAAAARNYLGITGSGGSGSVTNFSIGNLAPLFTATVTTPTTFPTVSYSLISQSPNTVFAGPSSGSGNPTFRTLVSGDIPSLTLSKISDAGNVAGINTDGNPSHFLDGTGNWSTPSGGGGGSGGIDMGLTNLTAYANGTNFYIDLGFQSCKLFSASDISFNYATNFPAASTSRVDVVYIPATNYLRHVSFQNLATNWHLQPLIFNIPAMRGARVVVQAFGAGDTNVTFTPYIDSVNAPIPQVFDLSSITTATNVLWIDAERGTYQDQRFLSPADDNRSVRGWQDQSGFGNNLTNITSTDNTIIIHNAMSAPFNIPCVEEFPGGTSAGNIWLKSGSVSGLAHPMYVFIMGYSLVAGNNQTMDSLSGSSTRMLCDFVFGGNCTIASENTSSFTGNNTMAAQWALFTFVFNGSSSAIRTNAANLATGTVASVVPNGFTFGSDINATVPTGRTFVSEVQVWRGPLTSADLGNIETNYFRKKYGAW